MEGETESGREGEREGEGESVRERVEGGKWGRAGQTGPCW